ncbi:MAG: helix-turn-helix transcriptional regulator [Bacteroidota bacterium]|nr:helix-turn-helix transcriptional regulator [Bacteroidota bacterium]
MEKQFKQIASLIGDPTRAAIMWTLLDGKAFTATELAIAADTSPQNISMHLAKLVQADLLYAEIQGRHRYYKFSRKDVAYAIEAMASLVPNPDMHDKSGPENSSAIKYCRSCYDHVAGKVGVSIADGLLRQKIIIEKNKGFEVSAKGKKWFLDLGIDVAGLKLQRRVLLRPCLDWSERRNHIAGSLGAALLDKMLSSDWVRRTKNSRALVITAKGQKMLYGYFRINV